jgi:hypothetical protein
MLDERNGMLRPTYGWRTPKEKPEAFVDTQSYTGDTFAEPVTDYKEPCRSRWRSRSGR